MDIFSHALSVFPVKHEIKMISIYDDEDEDLIVMPGSKAPEVILTILLAAPRTLCPIS